MIPTRKSPAKKALDLYRRVCTGRSLETAWRHVEKRAADSEDDRIREALAKFRTNPTRELAAIGKALRAGSFVFLPQRGYAKSRKGKTSRPIVVAPLVNRIVQRAILNVCQEQSPSVRRALGGLPDVIDSPTSVGGLPGRGVPEAVDQILSAIENGAKWYVRSDLVNFFTRIPKPEIEAFLTKNVFDTKFVDLFMQALKTELANAKELRADLELFPTGKIGVPQGSALSALCANIVLVDFDRNLNGRGITTIRYLDDFVILGPTKQAVEKAWKEGQMILKSVGLEAHDPSAASGKASKGQVSDGFDFLSFTIRGKTAAPCSSAKAKLLRDIDQVIRDTKREINDATGLPRRRETRLVQSLALIDKKVCGWGDAFRSSTQRLAFVHMDAEVADRVEKLLLWFGRHTKGCSKAERMRKMGIALLADTPVG